MRAVLVHSLIRDPWQIYSESTLAVWRDGDAPGPGENRKLQEAVERKAMCSKAWCMYLGAWADTLAVQTAGWRPPFRTLNVTATTAAPRVRAATAHTHSELSTTIRRRVLLLLD